MIARLCRKFSSAPIRWQIATLLIVTQFLAHFLTINFMSGVLSFNENSRGRIAAETTTPLLTTLGIASALSGDARNAVFEAAIASDSRLVIQSDLPSDGAIFRGTIAESYRTALAEMVPAGWDRPVEGYFVSDWPFFNPFNSRIGAATQLDDGRWLVFTQSARSILQLAPLLLLSLAVSVLALPLTLLAIWSGSFLLQPLRELSSGVREFGNDLDLRPVPVRGASEIRDAAIAVNTMQERIKTLVDEKSHTLAAIAHDLRTPMTRLRLRAEASHDHDTRDGILRDLAGMEQMVHSALHFLRDQKKVQLSIPVNLTSIAQTVVDELSDQGTAVEFEASSRVIVEGDPDLLRRAIDNIVQNAVVHAKDATIRLFSSSGFAFIKVSDHGPGIPEDLRRFVLQPFSKGNAARSETAGKSGFGLGLSIANSIATAHGGRLTLHDNNPTGLVVTIVIPVAPGRTGQGLTRTLAHA